MGVQACGALLWMAYEYDTKGSTKSWLLISGLRSSMWCLSGRTTQCHVLLPSYSLDLYVMEEYGVKYTFEIVVLC